MQMKEKKREENCETHIYMKWWPHGDGLLMVGLLFTDYPPSWEKIPPVEDPGLCDPPGEPGWLS